MDNLRLILIIVGVAVIAGIYFWDAYREKKRQRQQIIPQSEPDSELSDFKITTKLPADEDYSSTLSELKEHISASDGYLTGMGGAHDSEDFQPMEYEQEAMNFNSPEENDFQEKNLPAQDEEPGVDNIIVLHITALPTKPFAGEAIVNATKLVGLVYGEMNIYHHFGVGDMRSEQALFSLANMYEPGYFKLDELDKQNIKGLTSFLSLPTPVDSQIVFELMLNTTQRLAEFLGGEVRGPSHKLLNEADIGQLREKITQFDA